jgi:hypothetical protein
VRIIEIREHPGFVEQYRRLGLRIHAEVRHLDRDVAIQLFVDRQVDRAETASSDCSTNSVSINPIGLAPFGAGPIVDKVFENPLTRVAEFDMLLDGLFVRRGQVLGKVFAKR